MNSQLYTFLYLLIVVLFGFIGICVLAVTSYTGKWKIEHILIFAAVSLGLIAIFNLHFLVTHREEPEMPSTMMTDTEVDALLKEVRYDDKTIYFDDEFQILVYKYLLKYTKEGKYETQNDPELDDILRKAREAMVHDEDGTASTTVDDQSGL